MGNCSLFLSWRLKQTFSNDGNGSGAGDESPKSISSFVQDKDFILDCLCWHNEYRARHSAAALTVSPEVSNIESTPSIIAFFIIINITITIKIKTTT